MEPFTNGFFGEDVAALKGQRGVERIEEADCDDFGDMRQADGARGRAVGLGGQVSELGPHAAGGRFVEVGRVKPEAGVLGAERAAVLGDAALAEDHRLPPAASARQTAAHSLNATGGSSAVIRERSPLLRPGQEGLHRVERRPAPVQHVVHRRP